MENQEDAQCREAMNLLLQYGIKAKSPADGLIKFYEQYIRQNEGMADMREIMRKYGYTHDTDVVLAFKNLMATKTELEKRCDELEEDLSALSAKHKTERALFVELLERFAYR